MKILKEKKFDKLDVRVYPDRKELGVAVAKEMAKKMQDIIKTKGEVRIVFASAPSQLDFLEALSKEEVQWSKVTVFNQDEYVGVSLDDDHSFGKFIRVNLYDKVNPGTIHYINGGAQNMDEEAKRYGELLFEKPIDIICLGIGENGHIAFNEPHEADFEDAKLLKQVSLDKKCRLQQVHDGNFSTIEKVPKYGVTMTIPSIMRGEYVYCIVPTDRKAEAVKKALLGPIEENCPSSILRTHDNSILFLDTQSSQLVPLLTNQDSSKLIQE